ncbi:hypothetical protein CUMW_276840 [Citrus unshiu]|uniref:Uncharacterized protein n=1 Tax=Citrus unshiu TaxID=55188 RepID=A0A2H5N2L1_CITUN|nr:hypothetical protein CUMW_276840 [Citrus unshiu]
MIRTLLLTIQGHDEYWHQMQVQLDGHALLKLRECQENVLKWSFHWIFSSPSTALINSRGMVR